MHLVAPLTAGVRGAENGTVSFLLRGTSTAATYYADFEGTQQLPSPAALDSYGRLVAYVSALVDVRVHDSSGVDVCGFVAGAEDAAVEVISPSFTGVDYTSGASGTQKPTNLENVLDAWFASSGAADWKVLFNGAPTNLSAALSATFFNVRNYGALGNGIADDGTAILNAQAAATAAGGGTVYFPPGVYRITAAIALAANVAWLGSGGQSSRLAVDSAASVGALTLPGNPVGSISSVSQMWLNAINGASPGSMVTHSAASSGEFHFTDCIFGNDLLCTAVLCPGAGGTSALKQVYTRCFFKITSGTAQLLINSGTARLEMRDCDLINANAVGFIMVDCPDNGVFEGNRFDWSAAAAGPGINYIRMAPTVGSVVVVGNTFVANTAMATTAIFNTLAVPNRDVLEYGNVFGNMASATPGCTPYGYTTDGYATIATGNLYAGGHQTRYARTEIFGAVVGANQAVDPKAYGTSIIKRTGGANITVDANKGSLGDRWTLHVNNTSGGAINVVGGTNVVLDGALAVNNNGFAEVQLAWLPTAGGVGNWYQVAKAVLS